MLDSQYAVESIPEITIKMSHLPDAAILSCYLFGYETIIIEAPKVTSDDINKIKQTISHLIGVEIIEENHQKVVLQCLLKASAFPPEKVLRREYVLSSSMFKDAIHSFANIDLSLARSILKRDEEVNRLYFLLVRLLRTLIINPRLSEKLSVSLIDCLDYRLVATLIENIADQAVEMAKATIILHNQELPLGISRSVLEVGQKFQETYEEVIKAIFSKSEKLLLSAISKRENALLAIKKLESDLEKVQSEITPTLFAFSSSLRRVFDYFTDMIDLVTPHG
ncbi:MAG: phosphate uptake regulator PhoU [Candidatus Bathyarchaeota archaeon]